MDIQTCLNPIPTARNSFFISFEGIEGSGKSSQIHALKTYFENKRMRVLTLREPGGTEFGEHLRGAILESKNPLHPLAEAHLFASSRTQLLFEKVIPFLEQENSVVIADRYLDSSFAYQGMARGLGIKTIADIHAHSPLNYVPQKTFYLKIDLQTSMERQKLRGNNKDYFEKETQEFYQKLILGYDECAKLFPNRIEIIDATQSLLKVENAILSSAEQLCK